MMAQSRQQQLEMLVETLRSLETAYADAGLFTQRNETGGNSLAHNSPPLEALLQLCQALLRNVVGSTQSTDNRNQHVVVFGGTQVGKSTVVNIACGSQAARVFHTAGFTRHAQAFTSSRTDCKSVLAGFPAAFPGFKCVPVDALSLDRPDEFGVANLAVEPSIENTVFWDAPDCDAVDAAKYRRGMLEAVTVADVVVYVTSREKYAVNAILEWLVLLLRAGTPIVTCLNMVPVSQQAEISAALEAAFARVAERHGDDCGLRPEEITPIVAFDYFQGDALATLIMTGSPKAAELHFAVRSKFPSVATRLERAVNALQFLESASAEITAPALEQIEAVATWERGISTALNDFVEDYRRSYLDNPQRYDAFNRVGIEILALLNPPIPGLRKALVAVRTVLSLPARAILYGTRAIWRYVSSGGQSAARQPVVPNEVIAFRDANDRVLNSLAGMPLQRRAAGYIQPFWDALAMSWAATIPLIKNEFAIKLDQHRARTDEWIRETAEGIYRELAREPVTLNLLRTGRVAADAGAIIISIHTGGQGDILHDMLVTPVMMSLVEAISQQLASSYVEQRRRELRERLLNDIRVFAEGVYGAPMRKLGADALTASGFGGVPLAQLKQLGSEFRKLRDELHSQGGAGRNER